MLEELPRNLYKHLRKIPRNRLEQTIADAHEIDFMKKSELFFTLILIPLDFLALIAAGVAAYYARFLPAFVKVRPVIFDLRVQDYIAIVWPIAVLWLIIFAIAGLYSIRRKSIGIELTRVALACSTSMAVVFAILFFSRVLFESRFIAVAAWLLAIMFVASTRVIVRLIQKALLSFGIGAHRIAIIGDNKTSKALMELFSQKHRLGVHVIAHFKAFDKRAVGQLQTMKKAREIDEVILADPHAPRQLATQLLAFCDAAQIGFRYSADLFSAAVGRSIIHMFSGIPVIEVQKTPLDGWGAIYKRIFDMVVSLILIILTFPIQVLVALAVFLEQPGRILFSRLPNGNKTKRVGKNGEPFSYFKFRSMVHNAHKQRFSKTFVETYGNMREDTPLFKLKDDPRVTRVGKFLRRYSLDELPEFYLVLLGRMSLVGPRPHLPEEVEQYEPHHRKVHTVRPGITGLSQISGRADLDFEEEMRLDTHYIEHWSAWLDIYILLKTPLVVLFRKGAY